MDKTALKLALLSTMLNTMDVDPIIKKAVQCKMDVVSYGMKPIEDSRFKYVGGMLVDKATGEIYQKA